MQKTSDEIHFKSKKNFKKYLESTSRIDFESAKSIVENNDFVKDSLFEDLSKKLSDDLTVEQFIYWIDLRKSKKINDIISIGLQKLKNDLTFDEIENLIETIESSKHAKELVDVSKNLGTKNSDLNKAVKNYFIEKEDSKEQEFTKKIREAIAAEKIYLKEIQSVLKRINKVLNCRNLLPQIDEIDEIINKKSLYKQDFETLIAKINNLNQSIANLQIAPLSKRNPGFQFKRDDLKNVINKMKKIGNEEGGEEDLTYFFKIAFENNISMDWNLFVLIINKFSNFDFMKLVNFYFETFRNGFEKISDKDRFLNKAKAVCDLLMKKIDFKGIIVAIDSVKIINIIKIFFDIQGAADNIEILKKDRKKLEKNQIDDKKAKATIEKAIEEEAKMVNKLVLEMSEFISGVLKKFFAQHRNFNESDINIINKMIVAVLKKFFDDSDDLFNEFDFVNIFSFLYNGSEFFNEFSEKVGELSVLALKLSEEDYKNDDIEGKAQDANELAQISIELLSGILKNFLAKNEELNESNRNMLNKMIIVVLKKFIGGNDDLYNEFDFVNIFSFLYNGSEFFNEFSEKVGKLSVLALKLSEKDYGEDIETKTKDEKEFFQKIFELILNVLDNFFEQHKNLNESDKNIFNEIFSKCNNLLKRFWFRSNLEVKFSDFDCDIFENSVNIELFTPLLEKIKEINLKLPPLLMFILISIFDNVENDDTFKDYFKKNYVAEFDFTNGIELYQLLYLFKCPQLLNFDDKILDNFLNSDINLCLLEGNNKKSDDLHGVSDVSSIKKDDEHYYCVGFFYEDSFSIYVSENSLKFSEVQPLLEKIISNIEQLNFWLPFFYFAIKDTNELIRFLNEKKIDINCLSLANGQSKPELVFNNFCIPFPEKKSMKLQEERKKKEEEEQEKKEKEEQEKREKEEQEKREQEEREKVEQEEQEKLLFKDIIKQNVKLSCSKLQEFKSKKEYESNIKENKKTNDEEVNQKKRMILFGGFALFFLVLTLTISILTFGTGTIPMLALGSILIYNSVFGALTAGLGVGFFTFAVLFLKSCVSYFRSKSEKSLEVLNESENSLPNKSESELNEDVSGNQIRTSKSLIDLSDISNQINEEKPRTTGEDFENTQVDEI